MTAPSRTDLEQLITGRLVSFFDRDVGDHSSELRVAAEGRRVLVVGGAGSIGAATTRSLLGLRPAAVHIVDISENYLAELIRDIRSGTCDVTSVDLQAHVFDYGAEVMRRFLATQRPFDIVLNFAAVKHVRSEKDVFSLLHMLDVNIVRQARFKRWLAEFGHRGRYFTVSTDKAANPSSLMGASKRVMEDVAFAVREDALPVTSARFANVAFSNGSLLQAFLVRLEKRQPLAVPVDTRRYFITHAEAADVCLLTALVAPAGHVLIPVLRPEEHLWLLQDIAERVLAAYGYAAAFTDDEAAAKAAICEVNAGRSWPVLLTPLDTMGEKPYEEFLAEGEHTLRVGFETLLGIRHRPNAATDIDALVMQLERYIENPTIDIDKNQLAELLGTVVPTLRHVDTRRHLDTRM
jgi:FlaA1/EpsC-like NDP-sugar epimerase